MNEELITARLDTLEQKIDKLTELTQQTALQEYRITKLEETIVKIQDKKENHMWKWLTPAISAIVAAVISFVMRGGLN